jgi:hypothetical protein
MMRSEKLGCFCGYEDQDNNTTNNSSYDDWVGI